MRALAGARPKPGDCGVKSDHQLTFVWSDELEQDPSVTLQRVLAAWPGPRGAPEVRRVSLGVWFSELIEGAPAVSGAAPALVVCDPGEPRGMARALVDRMHQLQIPGVLLRKGREDADHLAGAGVLVEAPDVDPVRLAAMLYALGERQPVVESLRSELRVLNAYQSGVRDEMDRVHDELHLAALIQRDLLPAELPRRAGVEFAVMFRPASYVSGDIYDVVEMDRGRIAFLLADAVGHGVPAALLTMVISRALRAPRPRFDPADALSTLNNDMVRMQRGRSRFATAVCGVIDPSTREVTLCVAGHPAPLRIFEGEMVPIDTGGPLLGVFESEAFESETFTMREGETLLLYSDGFETAFPGEDKGDVGAQKRLQLSAYLDELRRLPWPGAGSEEPLAGAIEALGARLDSQPGSLRQLDDLTALGIRARGVGSGRVAA
jgi:sigma-B regulation protein RsbU (phosphoserine phosphatase)